MADRPWNLVADIGGTNARFAVTPPGNGGLQLTRQYSVAEYPRFTDALLQYLQEAGREGGLAATPRAACFALAAPVTGDRLPFTNSTWCLDRREVTELLHNPVLELINDFEAVGYGVTALEPEDWIQVHGGTPDPSRPIAVLGPGTGLGVCSIVPVEGAFKVLPGEGGHVDFAPVDDVETEILRFLTRKYGRVSAERILSGDGLVNIYSALAAVSGGPVSPGSPAQITDAAIDGGEPLALQALQVFCRCLGSFAGNLALILGAKGGVYIAGGIVPRFPEFLRRSGFGKRFGAKGRFSGYLEGIPVRVITSETPGLAGAAIKLKLTEQ